MTMRWWFIVFVTTLVPGWVTGSESGDILGCGGFVKSAYKLDFDKIEIKLFTKQGSLKMKTECAPTTGYYFIPLDGTGDYVLKISPPEGWSFNPPEYQILIDGKTDLCSTGSDINFDFMGFSILSKVVTTGFNEGPQGVTLTLAGPEGLKMDTKTSSGGSFSFESIPPGKYSLKATHPSLTFDKDTHAFEINNKNVVVDNQISVRGYDVSGRVLNDGNAVRGVVVLLLGKNTAVKSSKSCGKPNMDGIKLPENVPGEVLCQQVPDETGVFRFSSLTPGKYTILPVYKGKTTVYNFSPDRFDFDMGHESLELPNAFEIEGFTVLGRVKGLQSATVMVNGKVKATSGHDGSFTIAKMKPGTYNFQIVADKFQFDAKDVMITAADPTIPDFVPSRFLTCGKVELSSKAFNPQITLALQKTTNTNQDQIIREKLIDPDHSCVFLPEGSFIAWLESSPEKYFQPEKNTIKVPATTDFYFKEFMGSIGGSLSCRFSSCTGLKIIIENRETGQLVDEKVIGEKETRFKFENLDSGDYRIRVPDATFCWKEVAMDKLKLKNINIDDVSLVQNGYALKVVASHSTKVKISGKGKSTQEASLVADEMQQICLGDVDSPADSYVLEPVGCHKFDQSNYPFKLGETISLEAKKHSYSGILSSPDKITDLKLTKNGISFNYHQLTKGDNDVKIIEKTLKDGLVQYEIVFIEGPNANVEMQVFSYGYTFEPNSFSIKTGDDCQNELFTVEAQKSHVIKGKLNLPLEGVEVKIELVGDPDATTYVTTNADGEYIAGPFIHSSGFKVTPEMTGYTFKATPSDPYSFSVHQLARIQVRVEAGTEPVSSVLLSLSGPSSYRQNKMTDANGEMTFGELQPGQYYMKAFLKEFQFEPGSLNIDLQDQEAKKIVLKATRESFSMYGQLSSLSGELIPNLLVSARGKENCSEYGEEGSSDDMGNFRIWALKSYCDYQISVVKKDDFANRVERTIPDHFNIKMGESDVHNVSFVVITPVRRMDVSLRCFTNNDISLDGLKAVVYSSKSLDTPLHTVSFNGISYIILPPIPKDGTDYFVTFESSLSKFHYTYNLPAQINFTANGAYAHFDFKFNIERAPVDQEIGKSSYFAVAMMVVGLLVMVNYDKISVWAKDLWEKFVTNAGAGSNLSKKSKQKTK